MTNGEFQTKLCGGARLLTSRFRCGAHLSFYGVIVLLEAPVFRAFSLTPCFSWVFAIVSVSEPLQRFIGTRETAEAVGRPSSR
jgi:hypothetical protein